MNRFLLATFIFIGTSTGIQAQCPSCDAFLSVIYDKTHIQKSDNFTQSFASWFFSDDFKTQVTSDKSGLSITIPFEGVPVTFGGNDCKFWSC